MLKLKWPIAGVFIVGLYLAFLTRTYYWDGVLFSIYIENAARGVTPVSGLLHPNHLLYTVLGFAVYSAISALHISARAITVLQVLDVVASAAAACILYRVALRVTQSRSLAMFCFVLFATGATWWKFSTDADAYTVAVLCEVLACYFAFREGPNWVFAGVCHACGMVMHELVVFMYVPIVAALWVRADGSFRRRLELTATYCCVTGAAVAAAYLLSYHFTDHRTYATLLKWMTSYSGASFTSSAGELITAYLASYTKLFAGGKVSFLREYFSVPLCMGLAVCASGLASAAVLFRKGRNVEESPSAAGVRLLWAWFIPYAIFLALFDPGSTFHKLFIWPALVLLIGVYAGRTAYLREHARALTAVAVALAAWNFAAFIYPHSHASADPVLALALKINRELPRNADVYYAAFAPDDWYLQYFAPGRKWATLPTDAGTILNRPGPVCLETTALAELERTPGVKLQLDPERRWDLLDAQHHIRFECLK